MTAIRILAAAALFAPCRAQTPDVREIVQRAAAAMQADWDAAPQYAFRQRDVTESGGKTSSRTHQVVMIAGSDYYMPVAINDVPLEVEQQRAERLRLLAEVRRRAGEDRRAAEQRAETYRRQREQNGLLIAEFSKAFDFVLEGEESLAGQEVFHLTATPRAGYVPPNRTAKILTGMKGNIRVGKDGFHWVRAECTVVKAVSIFGIFARVLPGTRMEMEMTPVQGNTWLVSRFMMRLRVSKFLFFESTGTTTSEYSDYRDKDAVLRELMAAPQGQ